MIFQWSKNLSGLLYEFMLDPREGGSTDSFNVIFVNNNGLEWCLFFLLGVSLIFAFLYYCVIAAKASGATIGNYIYMYVAGYVALCLITLLGLSALVNGEASVLTSFNVWKICIINILWYTILYEIISLLFKDVIFAKLTKANNIHLISILFNK